MKIVCDGINADDVAIYTDDGKNITADLALQGIQFNIVPGQNLTVTLVCCVKGFVIDGGYDNEGFGIIDLPEDK